MSYLQMKVDSRGVAQLTLARADALNAVDETMIAEFARCLAELAPNSAIRCLLITAEGRIFCAGADIHWMQRQSRGTYEENLADATRFADMMRALHDFPRPVIARVQGHAFGLGVGLMAASDIVIAARDAEFAVSEAKFGIIPAVIGPYLVQAVGRRCATRLGMECLRFSAESALGMGLIHEIADAAELDRAVERTMEHLLASGPAALGEIKSLYRDLDGAKIDRGLGELTARTIARIRAGEEAREGFAAFLEKRPASWARR